MKKIPPEKNGKIIDGKYIWNYSKKLPNYLNDGEDIIKQYNQYLIPGTYNFFMGDSEEMFKKNLKIQSDDWYYKDKKIEYTINSYGYRTKEFDEIDWKNSILLFGCSCVFGVGVSDDETLSHYLSKILNKDVINLGIPGGSNELIVNNSLMFKKKFGAPYGVIIMWTTMDRLVYYNDNSFHHIGPWDFLDEYKINDINVPNYKSLYHEYFFSKTNEIMNAKNNSNIGKEIWENNTKFFNGSFFEDSAHYCKSMDFFPFSNSARDLSHPGKNDFYRIANEINNFNIF